MSTFMDNIIAFNQMTGKDAGIHLSKQYSAEQFTNYQFFIGVVESREDPAELGRIKVRCYGIHPDSKSDVSTADLPWAMPIMPYTSASTSGIGESPTGPVEGTRVFGFFMDGAEMNQPMILGTMIGAPDKRPKRGYGFHDPKGKYPIITTPGESSVNKLARGKAINSVDYSTRYRGRAGEHSLANKIKNKYAYNSIPTAVPPRVVSVQDGPPAGKHPVNYWKRRYFDEPNPRYGGSIPGRKAPLNLHAYKHTNASARYGGDSKYPLNHVRVTETGHIFEVDDSPGAGRIHQYHNSGTFEEIQPNGTRVTKVVGDDFEVVMCDKNMMVSGNVNITVNNADLRLYVHSDPGKPGGDMYTEVDGHYSLNVKGNYTQKIAGAKHTEVLSDMVTNVNQKHHLRVGVDKSLFVVGNNTIDIAGDEEKTISGNEQNYVFKDSFKTVTEQTAIISGDDLTIHSSNNLNQRAVSNVNIHTEKNLQANADIDINLSADINVDIDAGKGGLGGDVEIDTDNSVKIGNDTNSGKPILVDIDATKIDLN